MGWGGRPNASAILRVDKLCAFYDVDTEGKLVKIEAVDAVSTVV
jgi:hypothetical protein